MKNQVVSNLPRVTIIKGDESFAFLKGKNLFAEKHARAKEMLSKMNLPEGFGGK